MQEKSSTNLKEETSLGRVSFVVFSLLLVMVPVILTLRGITLVIIGVISLVGLWKTKKWGLYLFSILFVLIVGEFLYLLSSMIGSTGVPGMLGNLLFFFGIPAILLLIALIYLWSISEKFD